MKNERIQEVKNAIRQPWVWPGGYPKVFVSYDGLLCHECVKANIRSVFQDIKSKCGAWNVSVDVLWEGPAYCADCSKKLESAYGDVKVENV